MCTWNKLFRNNEGWGRTLINLEKKKNPPKIDLL